MLKKAILFGLFLLLTGSGGFSQVHTNVGTEFWFADTIELPCIGI